MICHRNSSPGPKHNDLVNKAVHRSMSVDVGVPRHTTATSGSLLAKNHLLFDGGGGDSARGKRIQKKGAICKCIY